MVIRSDNSVALSMSKKISLPTKTLNYLAAEIALLLERARITKLVPQHVPGKFNTEADWLSSLGDRGQMPPTLVDVKIRRTTELSERRVAMAPPGVEGSPWIQSVPHLNGVYDNL